MANESKLLTAAVAGLMSVAALSGVAAAKDKKGKKAAGPELVKCYGVNKCGGHGKCGGEGHSCAGMNSCKGKGWLLMPKESCENIEGGSLTPPAKG